MAAPRKRASTVARKSKNSKFKNFLIAVNPFSPRHRLFLFILVFGLIGAGILIYVKAATLTPVFYIRNSNTPGNADWAFAYGNQPDKPVSCDWDGNRSDGIAVRQEPNVEFHISDTLNPTKVTKILAFGNIGDLPVCGDWDGNGKAGVGVFRPSDGKWYLSDEVVPNKVSKVVPWGNAGDIPLVCDWDGNGKDDIGLYRPNNSTFYISFNAGGHADVIIPFGNPGDLPVCGRWGGGAGGRAEGIGVYRPSTATYYLSDTISPSKVTRQFVYGNPGDKPLVGDWDGDGVTTVGIYRMAEVPSNAPAAGNELKLGMKGPAVTALQQRLAGRGFWIAATGEYNTATETTVKWFQATRRLPANGIAGPKTFAQLDAAEREGWRFNPNDPLLAPLAPPPAPAPPAAPVSSTPTLQLGSSGNAVASLQHRLANRGFWVATSGNFDQATLTVVRWFQAVRGIGVDGIVGPQTWGQIAAAEAEGWRFNPNDPLLTPLAPPPPVVINPGVGGPPPPGGPTADEINAYFEALRRAEEEARMRREQPPVEVPRTLPVGYCELWKQSGGNWIRVKTIYVITEQLCWNTNITYASYNLHHIDWVGADGKRKEVWTKLTTTFN